MSPADNEKGSVRSRVLHTAAKMFLEKGYSQSTMREISQNSGVNYGSLTFAFKSKENILCELVAYVLEGQFEATHRLLDSITDDKILFYAAETTLQLYMAESSEHIREMYSVSYSLPHSSQIIYRTITGKLEDIFGEHLPHLETKDFYEREIASGGIMRGFLTVPCDIYFTMDRKVKSFLETTFLVYEVPKEKIDQAIEFVSRFDFKTMAQNVIDNMLSYLESKT
ncbi:MAG: TetR/AcrR family transcriptional regulator [Ruminococcaceae bacterium]|nr:TetR/AcrR family transcriptional regulator [Oscillospiraceae bacterium]